MDVGNFTIMKYNGEGVDPGAFDGTGTGDLPLVISANKSKERNPVTQEMTLKEVGGDLTRKVSIIQQSIPLFIDSSGGDKEITVDYRGSIDVVFFGRANGKYIRYRIDDFVLSDIYTNGFDFSIISDKTDPMSEVQYSEYIYGNLDENLDEGEGYTSVTDDYYDGGTSTYEWRASVYYEYIDNPYGDGALDPGEHSFFIDVADKPFPIDIGQDEIKSIECKINITVPVSKIYLHWKRIAVDKMEYYVVADYEFGNRIVNVMLNNKTYTAVIPDGSYKSEHYTIDYTTSAAVNPAIISSTDNSYKVGSVIMDDWAFMSTPVPNSGIPNSSKLGATDIAGTSTFNLYGSSRLFFLKSSVSTDTFSYIDMSPSNDYDATYTVTMFSQPNVLVETKHVIGVYKSYPGTPIDTKTIVQDAYTTYHNLSISFDNILFEELHVDLYDSNGTLIQSTVSTPNSTGTENVATFTDVKTGIYSVKIINEGFEQKNVSGISINEDKTITVNLTETAYRIYANSTFVSDAVISMPNSGTYEPSMNQQVFYAKKSNLSDKIEQLSGSVNPLGINVFSAPSTKPNIYSFVDFNITKGYSCTLEQVLKKVYSDTASFSPVWIYFRDIATT